MLSIIQNERMTRSLSTLKVAVPNHELSRKLSTSTAYSGGVALESKSFSTIFNQQQHSKSWTDIQNQQSLFNDFAQDMNVIFKGDIHSVSAFQHLSSIQKAFSFKKLELGSWSKKVKVALEIGTR